MIEFKFTAEQYQDINLYVPTPSRTWDKMAHCYFTGVAVMQQQGCTRSGCLGECLGWMRESTCLGLSCHKQLPAGPHCWSTFHCGLWLPRSQDVQAEAGWEAESGCGRDRVQRWEQERQAGGVSVVIHSVCQNNHVLQHIWRKSNRTLEV